MINCFSCPNPQVVASAIGVTAVLLPDAEARRMFRLANGLNGLMQIEESWSDKYNVSAAKVITNFLHGGRGTAE